VALVSVLIPTWSGGRLVLEALASAQAQTHEDLEILVGEDASPDDTPARLDEAAAGDPRVRILHRERNLGHFDNPITLLEEARGEYVKFLLHDDLLAPTCVERLVAGMEVGPRVRLAFSRRAFIDEQGGRLPTPPSAGPITQRDGVIDGRELGDTMLENWANPIGELTTVLFRRSDLPDPRGQWQVDGRRMAAVGDIGLWLTLLQDGDAYYTPDELSSFRQHGAQNSADPRMHLRGLHEWPRLVDWARRRGYLARAEQERRAYAAILRMLGGASAAVLEPAQTGLYLETMQLISARLLELGDAAHAGDPGAPLTTRAHDPVLLEALRTELQDLPWRIPYALAAPRMDEAELRATVRALRTVPADHLVLAIAPADVDAAVPILEAAMAEGEDLDIELVPTDDPASLLGTGWLAVVPEGGAPWARRAARVHAFTS
jgi:glycosyltransferase involved in cell wall biosynthesis